MNISSSTSSSTTSSSYYNRITGLASGIDTDSVVKAQMQKYQKKIDSAEQQKQLYEWQQEAYRDVISDLKQFYSKYADVTNKDTNMVLSANYKTASFSTADTSAAVSAEGLAGATLGNYNIKVAGIAARASGIFGDLSSLGTKPFFAVNGKNISVDLADCATDDEKAAKINGIFISEGIEAKVVKSTLSGYIIQTNNMGASQSLEIESDGQTVLSAAGKDADVIITDSYGTTAERSFSSNSFIIDNVKFTISGTTGDQGVAFTGKTDVSALKDRIVNFVNDYNKLISGITEKLQEKKDRDYPPLTDAQKENMTDDQIQKWEAKAKTGILRNDSYLSSIISKMRTAINTPVKASALQYADFGLNFENEFSKAGQLTIDETKLSDALQKNPDEFMKLFTNISYSTDKTANYNETGIMQRIKGILNDNVNVSSSLLLKKAGYPGSSTYSDNSLQSAIDKQTGIIKNLKSWYSERETALYKKYSELEAAMTTYNYRLSALNSMLGGY